MPLRADTTTGIETETTTAVAAWCNNTGACGKGSVCDVIGIVIFGSVRHSSVALEIVLLPRCVNRAHAFTTSYYCDTTNWDIVLAAHTQVARLKCYRLD